MATTNARPAIKVSRVFMESSTGLPRIPLLSEHQKRIVNKNVLVTGGSIRSAHFCVKNIFPQFQQTIFYQTIINSIQTKKNRISAGSYRDFNNKKYSVIIRIYPQTDNLFYILIHKFDKQIKKELYVKRFDQLTDLENRFSYDQNIKNFINSKNQLSFILIDLKHFNKFNVTYGHSTSDLILIEIANRLKNAFHHKTIYIE